MIYFSYIPLFQVICCHPSLISYCILSYMKPFFLFILKFCCISSFSILMLFLLYFFNINQLYVPLTLWCFCFLCLCHILLGLWLYFVSQCVYLNVHSKSFQVSYSFPVHFSFIRSFSPPLYFPSFIFISLILLFPC